MRRKGTVTLRVCHSAVNGVVMLLNILEEFLEVLMVMCSVLFICLIGCAVNGVERVHADTALETGCGLLSTESLHFNLLDQVIGALMDMCETVDGLACKNGFCCH